jgi:hypothetical protein
MAETTPTPTPTDTLDARPGESFGMLTKVAIVIAIIGLVMFAVYAVT